MKVFLTFFIIISTITSFAQDKNYALEIINYLSSKDCAGRSLGLGGIFKAKDYLINNLDNLGYRPIIDTFSYRINVFEKRVCLFNNKTKLKEGEDFIINADCPKTKSNDFKNYEIVEKLPYMPLSIKQTQAKVFLKKSSFDSLGKLKLIVDAKLKEKKVNNIFVIKKGEVDSLILLTAHYDHVGSLGKNQFFPGAHDNASGVAMLMDFAKEFANLNTHYSYGFLFFAGEELGLLGSCYFTIMNKELLKKIKFLVNLDMLGSGDEGITIVNGKVFEEEFEMINDINLKNNYLPTIVARDKAANSDHYYFYQNGVRCFYIYTNGQYKEYHSITDNGKGNFMPLYNQLYSLIKEFILKI